MKDDLKEIIIGVIAIIAGILGMLGLVLWTTL